MTPNGIEILIHCYCCRAPHPRRNAPAVQDTLEGFLSGGMIIKTDEIDVFTTTAKGRAHIAQLCALQWPTEAWVDENGKVIKE